MCLLFPSFFFSFSLMFAFFFGMLLSFLRSNEKMSLFLGLGNLTCVCVWRFCDDLRLWRKLQSLHIATENLFHSHKMALTWNGTKRLGLGPNNNFFLRYIIFGTEREWEEKQPSRKSQHWIYQAGGMRLILFHKFFVSVFSVLLSFFDQTLI